MHSGLGRYVYQCVIFHRAFRQSAHNNKYDSLPQKFAFRCFKSKYSLEQTKSHRILILVVFSNLSNGVY